MHLYLDRLTYEVDIQTCFWFYILKFVLFHIYSLFCMDLLIQQHLQCKSEKKIVNISNNKLINIFSVYNRVGKSKTPQKEIVLFEKQSQVSAFGLILSAFFPHFLAFGLDTERYEVSLCIQSECGKMWENCGPE